jgi:hypothetical protein
VGVVRRIKVKKKLNRMKKESKCVEKDECKNEV